MDGSIFNLGVNVTFTGIVIVFVMLILLVLIISAFALFSKTKNPKTVAKKTPVTVENNQIVSSNTNLAADDETEIIAVIAAAVAAMYSGSSVKPVIKSIKPASGARPIWAMAGLIENTRAF